MENPINEVMITSMTNLKEMIDVDTIIGNPVSTPDGTTIIPVSKVSFGLAAGGGQYSGNVDFANAAARANTQNTTLDDKFIVPIKYPFAGGSAAGVSITPIAFIFASNSQNPQGANVQLIPIDKKTTSEKLLEAIPDMVDKISDSITKLTEAKCRQQNQTDQQEQQN
ncbi:MAG: sporulation protein YtfJ [Ruminococcaceae bacterium]|nr:sporulation protein YtfJ [Oscillospiraceae bacterium]